MSLLLLLACEGGGIDSDRPARDSGNPSGDTGGDPNDTGSEDTGSEALPTASELVAEVRDRGDNAMEQIAAASGWPAAVAEGWLFVYRGNGSWSLAGELNGWAGEAMNCQDGTCWIVVDEASGGYKFTNGSDWVPDPWSRRYNYDDNGEMSLASASGAHLQRFFAVSDAENPARTVRALVPAGAATHVLYTHDGQNLFDPNAMWGGWRLQDSAPAGLLIVGIDNTSARMEEYTHVTDRLDGDLYGGEGDAYADYVQNTVRPLIAAELGEPATVGTMGSSLGGLIAFHLADRHPGEFAFAASLSGTFGWGSIGARNETMIQRYAAAGHRSTALYLDSGGSGSTCADSDGDGTNDDDANSADNYCETVQLRDVLSGAGYTFDQDLWHWWEPDAPHNEAAWADRAALPMQVFVGL